MPSTTNQKFVDIDVVSHPYGAGGEPLGETTAPLRSPRQRRAVVKRGLTLCSGVAALSLLGPALRLDRLTRRERAGN
jgi:hypothetical protein